MRNNMKQLSAGQAKRMQKQNLNSIQQALKDIAQPEQKKERNNTKKAGNIKKMVKKHKNLYDRTKKKSKIQRHKHSSRRKR